jgi:hypothetical protein
MTQKIQSKFLEEIETLARIRREKTTTIIAKAVEIGLDKLREETILDQYLKNQIKREEAIRLVGLDSVKLAERQRKAVLEDVKWGLYGA